VRLLSRPPRVIALSGALLAAMSSLAIVFTNTPYRGFKGEVFVTLERGAGTRAMANALADAGVIEWPWEFVLVRARHPSAKLQAGEYRFEEPATPREVFARIASGDVYFVELTVPEGSNMFDIAALVDASGLHRSGALSGEAFLRAASDPASIRDLAPAARTQEGYLFPATYRLSHSTTAAALCGMMTSQFRKEWKRLIAAQNSPGGVPSPDTHTVVTLASLVEKETGLPGERPIIAGVFTNRIKQNMRLDCDPTTIYAALLDHRYSGAIHRSDLDSKNPYNTYQNDGLPPGPIASPGRAALEAALHPAETEYLYFVAKAAGGGHQFSATRAEHEKAVRDYRHANSAKAAKTKGKAG
jgi:UPF0755 protein